MKLTLEATLMGESYSPLFVLTAEFTQVTSVLMQEVLGQADIY